MRHLTEQALTTSFAFLAWPPNNTTVLVNAARIIYVIAQQLSFAFFPVRVLLVLFTFRVHFVFPHKLDVVVRVVDASDVDVLIVPAPQFAFAFFLPTLTLPLH